MPDHEKVQADLDRLLRESAELRETSVKLAREAERLRRQIAELNDGRRAERRKKPRLMGK
jgi:cell division protein FtsB